MTSKSFPLRSYVLPLSENFFKIDLVCKTQSADMYFRLVWGEFAEAKSLFLGPEAFLILQRALADVVEKRVEAQEISVPTEKGPSLEVEILQDGDEFKVHFLSESETPMTFFSWGEASCFLLLFQEALRAYWRFCNWFELPEELVAQPAYGLVRVHNGVDDLAVVSSQTIFTLYESVLDLERELLDSPGAEFSKPLLTLKGEEATLDLTTLKLTLSWSQCLLFVFWMFHKSIVHEDPNFQYWKKHRAL